MNLGPVDFESGLGWRQLSNEDREREYSPSSSVGGDIGAFLANYRSESDDARRACAEAGRSVRTIAYGEQGTQTIDLVTPAVDGDDNEHGDSAVPCVVYIHGGYWQQLSKLDSFSPAHEFGERGIAYAAVDYTLAPHATLAEIVDECRAAVAHVRTRAGDFGIDSERIIIAGSSAGGHLSAMVGLEPDGWRPAALVLLSGVFELEPLVGTSINDAVGLDAEQAQQLSPARLPMQRPPDTVVAWGEIEPQQFKLQSQLMAQALHKAGASVTSLEAAGRNHFNIVGDLGDVSTALGAAVDELIWSTTREDVSGA